MSSSGQAPGAQRPDFFARFQSAIPLLVVYFGLAALYAWQASRRPVPTIFTDELELTQLARAIAETGEPARRGEAYGLGSLAAYVLAPVWWLGSSTASWAAAKLILVLAMTATVFPAYGLARLVVPRWYALGAAAAAVAVPALAYSPFLVEEPLAYPLSTLALLLIARSLVSPTWGRLAAATAAALAATFARTQLSILFAVFALGLLWIGWQSEPVRRWRSGWSRWDWAGGVILVVGAALAFSAAMGHASTAWRETTFIYKDRIFEHASWAMGALAIGIGVLPVLAGIAALARPRSEEHDPRTRGFVVTSVAALIVFIAYAGIKGAYNSTVFSTLIVERNLIYLCPVLFAATALAFARGVGRGWAIAGAAVFTVYVVTAVPLRLDQYPYYEAHGLSIAAFANRELGWAEGTIEALLIGCLRRRAPRRGRAQAAPAVARSATRQSPGRGGGRRRRLEHDRAGVRSGGRAAILRADREQPAAASRLGRARRRAGHPSSSSGSRSTDPTGVWLTEFFNPSIRKMWSTRRQRAITSVPGRSSPPTSTSADGTLTPVPETEYALALNGISCRRRSSHGAERDASIASAAQPLTLSVAARRTRSTATAGWASRPGDPYARYDVRGSTAPGELALVEARLARAGARDPASARRGR